MSALSVYPRFSKDPDLAERRVLELLQMGPKRARKYLRELPAQECSGVLATARRLRVRLYDDSEYFADTSWFETLPVFCERVCNTIGRAVLSALAGRASRA